MAFLPFLSGAFFSAMAAANKRYTGSFPKTSFFGKYTFAYQATLNSAQDRPPY
jgi:hypothetical protein